MKIVVISFSGNVGKSTIARLLLSPRINDAEIFSIESMKSDGTKSATVDRGGYEHLRVRLSARENAIVDVGACSSYDFLSLMIEHNGSHEDFDYFIVPTVSGRKQQRDTISTIDALAEIGISSEKIRVIFNVMEMGDQPERAFSGLFEYGRAEAKFAIRPKAVMYLNELYDKLQGVAGSIREILADDTDYKEEIKTAQNSEEKVRFAKALAIRRLAEGYPRSLTRPLGLFWDKANGGYYRTMTEKPHLLGSLGKHAMPWQA